MMFLLLGGLLVLFYLLGLSADLVIINTKRIGQKLGLNLFFLGLILGFFTSLPEMAVAINSLINNVPNLSVGNLWGSFFVLFGLILGASVLLNRQISTDGRVWSILPIFFLLLLPMLLALDNQLNLIEGLMIITLYFAITLYLIVKNIQLRGKILPEPKNKIIKNIFLIFLGLVLVIILSHFIISITLYLLSIFNIPEFIIGLILFSVGTNLPEITMAIKSWQNRVRELSFSNLFGSAMVNTLIIGIMAIFRPLLINVDINFVYMFCSLLILFLCLLFFYRSNKSITKNEGLILIFIYLIFLLGQVFITLFHQ